MITQRRRNNKEKTKHDSLDVNANNRQKEKRVALCVRMIRDDRLNKNRDNHNNVSRIRNS